MKRPGNEYARSARAIRSRRSHSLSGMYKHTHFHTKRNHTGVLVYIYAGIHTNRAARIRRFNARLNGVYPIVIHRRYPITPPVHTYTHTSTDTYPISSFPP